MACEQNHTKDKQSSPSKVIEKIKQPTTRRQTQTKNTLPSLSEVTKKETQRHANNIERKTKNHHHQTNQGDKKDTQTKYKQRIRIIKFNQK